MDLKRISALAGALLATGCLVPDVNLEGKACSTGHPCAEAYQCVLGKCELPQDVVDSGPVDAGATDAGPVDSGPPTNVGTLTGDFGFNVGHLLDDSVVLGGRGQNVTVVMSQNALNCDAYDTQVGDVIEIDATEPNGSLSFAPGTFAVSTTVDGGPIIHMELRNNLADGGVSPALDSNFGAILGGITGTVTFTSLADTFLSGSFDVQLYAYADGGTSHLLGTFTANGDECP